MRDYTLELLAMLGKMIADEEMKVVEATRGASRHDDPATDRWIKDEWALFHRRVEPIQKQRNHTLNQLVTLRAMAAPEPMIIEKGKLAL